MVNDIKVKKHGVHIIFYANKFTGKDRKLHRLFSATEHSAKQSIEGFKYGQNKRLKGKS
jgi:hypothetical protein